MFLVFQFDYFARGHVVGVDEIIRQHSSSSGRVFSRHRSQYLLIIFESPVVEVVIVAKFTLNKKKEVEKIINVYKLLKFKPTSVLNFAPSNRVRSILNPVVPTQPG